MAVYKHDAPLVSCAILLQCSSEEELEELLSGLVHSRGEEGEGGGGGGTHYPGRLKFTFVGLDGVEVELCQDGREKNVM